MKKKHKYSNQHKASEPQESGDNQSPLEIDIYHLEREWAGQPRLYEHYATRLAHAKHDLDIAKDNLLLLATKVKTKEAEIENDIRKFPDFYGIRRVTESAIEKTVILQPEYQEAQQQYHEGRKAITEAQHSVNLLESMVQALEHRKKALEKECDLFTSQYWSKPRAPDSMRNELESEELSAVYGKGKRRRDQ